MNEGQRITIRITADGEAFEADPDREVGRILAGIAERARDGHGFGLFVRDVIGKTVGTIRITGGGRRA
jgi:hypothetical protein